MKNLIKYVKENEQDLKKMESLWQIIEHLKKQGFNLTICPDESKLVHTEDFKELNTCKCGCVDDYDWSRTLVLDGKYAIYGESGCSCSEFLDTSYGDKDRIPTIIEHFVNKLLGEYEPHECSLWTEEDIKKLKQMEEN